jgi:SAM-dependent methyltransferase
MPRTKARPAPMPGRPTWWPARSRAQSPSSRSVVAVVCLRRRCHEVLHRAKRRNAEHVKFLLYDAEGDPHQAGIGGDFDAVCGVDILHHIERPILALSNWMRLVRPGGRLVILESNPKNPVLFLRLYGRPAERRVFKNTRKNLRTWASDAGWGSVSVSYAPIYLPNCRETLWPAFAAVEEVIHSMRIARPISGLYCVEALRPVAP